MNSRTDLHQAPLSPSPSRSSTPTPRTFPPRLRDKEMYLEDGNVTFLVHNRLFKIHRSVMERKSARFATICRMSAELVMQANGQGDEYPIVLNGDDPDVFSVFLQTMYDFSPSPIVGNINVPLALDVVCIAHKYGVGTVESTAASAALKFLPYYLEEIYEKYGPRRVIEVGELISHPTIRDIGIGFLKKMIVEERFTLYDALEIAEGSLHRLDFLGWTYYEIMLLGSDNWPKEDAVLSPERRANLYRGAFRLQELWHIIARECFDFEHSCEPDAFEECPSLTIWREEAEKQLGMVTEGVRAGDILENLRSIQKQIVDRSLYICVPAMKAVLDAKIQHLQIDLWKYFIEDDVDDPSIGNIPRVFF